MSPHYFVKHRTITVSLYCSPQKVTGSENSSCYVVWQRTSGKPTSQELFKITEFCVNERFQSVTADQSHNPPCTLCWNFSAHKALPQLVRIPDCYLVHASTLCSKKTGPPNSSR